MSKKTTELTIDSSLFECAKDLSIVNQWFIKGKVDLNIRYENGDTLLINLCRHLEMIDTTEAINKINELIDNGCDVNLQNNNGETALIWLCSKAAYNYKNSDVINKLIEKLLDNQANVDLLTDRDWSVLSGVCEAKNEALAIKFLDKSNLEILEKVGGWRSVNIMYWIYNFNLTKVLEHLKLIYRNSILESIDNDETIIFKSCSNQIFELNIIDMVVDLIC